MKTSSILWVLIIGPAQFKSPPYSDIIMTNNVNITNDAILLNSKRYDANHLLLPPWSSSSSLPRSLTNLIKRMGQIGLLDLERHFAFYGAYHSNPTNIVIHMIFVWPIFFTALILFHFTPPLLLLPTPHPLVLNFGFFFALAYAAFYLCLDKKAGTLGALMCFGCWVGASFVASQLGYSLAWKVVLASQLFCWTGQFIGHGVFEKRAPALLDNLVQAFLMVPFFVLLEALQSFFGYEPYPGFHARVNGSIQAEINEWQAKKHKKLA